MIFTINQFQTIQTMETFLKKIYFICLCVCVCVWERESVCVCVCVYETETESMCV